MSISTHVLDTSRGRPGQGIDIELLRQTPDGWRRIGGGKTNEDGRVPGLLPEGQELEAGVHRMTFATGAYFEALGGQGFYPLVEITFEIVKPLEHYHVPLLLNPFGYSTYRGS